MRCLDYLQTSREIYAAVQRLPVSSLVSLISRHLSGFFSHSACGAAVVHDGGTDRENHATRRRGEIDSRCDAGDENTAQERRNARQDSRKLKERGEGCRVRLLRGARHYRSLFVAKSSGSRDECAETRNTFSNTCLDLRSFDEPRRPRTKKCLAERNLQKVEAIQGRARRC